MSKRRSVMPSTSSEPSKKPEEVPDNEDGDDLENPQMWESEDGGTYVGDIYIPPPTEPHCSTESTGSRLMITKIENVDFKSYAGKVCLGPFHYVSNASLF